MKEKAIVVLVLIVVLGLANDHFRVIENSLVGYIVGAVFSLFLQFAWFYIEKKSILSKMRYSPLKITPNDIMRNRGTKEYGFDEYLYYRGDEREIDRDLEENYKIAVVSGRIGSGKSRAIYEYIKTKCQDKFSFIYIINYSDDIKVVNDGIKSSKKNSLVIIDDVHKFYPEQKENLQKLFETIYQKESVTAIVTIATEHDINLIIDDKDFYSYINKLDCVLKKASEGIVKIEIDEIKRNDEVHKWCLANLRKIDFSPVIGTYIKPLESQISKKTQDFFKNEDAVDVLTAYTTIIKFRKDKGQYIRYVFLMYIAQRSYGTTKTLKNFNNGLRILVKLGYIEFLNNIKIEYCDGRRIGENETLLNIKKHIEDDHINLNSLNEKIQINDIFLYNDFQSQALFGNEFKTDSTELYLLHGKESEIRQVEALIRIDKNNPDYYGRAVTKSVYTDEIIEIVKKRMLQQFFVQHEGICRLNETIVNNNNKKEEISLLLSVIIGREKFKNVEDYQEVIEKYYTIGIPPTISTIGELLRIALYNYSIRDKMYEYANSLLIKHKITPSVYYYQRIEELNYGYNIENIKNACLCRKDDYEGVKSFEMFCNAILMKAKTVENIDILFDTILPEVDNHVPFVITFKKNSVLSLMDNFKSTPKKSKSDILIHYIKKICSSPQRIARDKYMYNSKDNNSNLKSLFIAAITKCDKFNKSKEIYDIGLSIIINKKTDDKYQRMLALYLFGQIKSVNDFFICNDIFLKLKSKKASDDDLKLFNKLLNKSPSYEYARDLFNTAGTINNKCDIYTINALLNVAKTSFKDNNSERWASEVLKIEEDRLKKEIDYDSHYLSHFYNVANQLIRENKNNEYLFFCIENVIKTKKEKKKNTVLDAQKIKILTTKEEVLKKAKIVLNDMKNDNVIESDICAHLLKKSLQFNSPDLYEIMNGIIENENKINRPKVYYYCNRFKYHLLNEKYGTCETFDMNNLKKDIEKTLTYLMRIGGNLFENNSDIFFTVMAVLNFDEAIDIVLFAKEMSKKYSINNKFEKIFRADLIVYLSTKIKEENKSIARNQGEKIQTLINNNPTLRFGESQRRKLSIFAKRNGFFIYYPLINPSKEVRYYCWDNEIEEGTIRNAFENDIQTFIKLEVYDLTCNLNKQDFLDETRLIQALEVLSERTNQINMFVNTDGFVNNPYRPEKATRYNHFFNAFWDLYSFKSGNKKKWKNLASYFGYILDTNDIA